jgi:hypothetical protein
MAKIKASFIECGHCGMKFRCPFYIGDTKTFSHAILWGNRVKCALCEVTIDCNEQNMSYVLEDQPDPHSRDIAAPQAHGNEDECWALV